jgi:hypothetical protein
MDTRDTLQSSTSDTPNPASVDDLSWATPRPKASKRLIGLVGLLAMTTVGLGGFAYGTKIGRSRASTAAAAGQGGFGRRGLGGNGSGFGGGFGGSGGGFGQAVGPSGTADPAAAAAATATTVGDPLGGLLAGAPPAADPSLASPDTTVPTTSASTSPVVGTIESIAGDVVVIKTATGSFSVRIGPTTAIGKTAGREALIVGTPVVVDAATTATQTPADATRIVIGPDATAQPSSTTTAP